MITVSLEFKNLRQEKEFDLVDARVQAILFYVSRQLKAGWAYQAVVTCIHRTPEENRAAGGEKNSAHLDFRAADIRLKDFKFKDSVPVLVDIINKRFKRTDGYPTAIAHGKGDSYHLHIQVPKL